MAGSDKGELSHMTREALDIAEASIQRGLSTFVEVGTALLSIRDGRGYRLDGHATFEDYCRTRWGMKKSHAYRMIDAAGVVADLSPIGEVPANEAQARPLADLLPDERREAWNAAREAAAEENRPVTARDVQKAADEINGSDRDPATWRVRLERFEQKWAPRIEEWELMKPRLKDVIANSREPAELVAAMRYARRMANEFVEMRIRAEREMGGLLNANPGVEALMMLPEIEREALLRERLEGTRVNREPSGRVNRHGRPGQDARRPRRARTGRRERRPRQGAAPGTQAARREGRPGRPGV